MTIEEYTLWTNEKLRRKIDQELQMASLAVSDGDVADARRRAQLALKYQRELEERR